MRYYLTAESFDKQLAPALNYPSEAGATKGVIITPYDYVIKLPFVGINDIFLFKRAPVRGGWNYLEAEMNIQKWADDAGVGECFAKLTPASKKYPIYIQKKVLTAENNYVDYTSKALREVHDDFSLEWQAAAYDWYGKKFYNQLLTFLNKHMILDDLRDNNVGYDPTTKQPLLMDWGGYWEV